MTWSMDMHVRWHLRCNVCNCMLVHMHWQRLSLAHVALNVKHDVIFVLNFLCFVTYARTCALLDVQCFSTIAENLMCM